MNALPFWLKAAQPNPKAELHGKKFPPTSTLFAERRMEYVGLDKPSQPDCTPDDNPFANRVTFLTKGGRNLQATVLKHRRFDILGHPNFRPWKRMNTSVSLKTSALGCTPRASDFPGAPNDAVAPGERGS